MPVKLIKKDNYIYKITKANPKKIKKYSLYLCINNFKHGKNQKR